MEEFCEVIDPHANFTEAMGRESDRLIDQRENPPTDAREAESWPSLRSTGLCRPRTGPRPFGTVRRSYGPRAERQRTRSP